MRPIHAPKSRAPRPKSERFAARVSAPLKKLFQEAASLSGTTLTDFVISSAEEAAKRTVRYFEIMDLSEQDRAKFVDSLLNPPEPSKRLREAAARYRKAIGL